MIDDLQALRSRAELVDDANSWFEYGGQLDRLGFENEAHDAYERVAEIGIDQLDDEHVARYYIQAGSTLRNIGRYKEACALLAKGRRRFPGNRAMDAFYSLALWSSGNHTGAMSTLLQALIDTGDASVRHYSQAIAHYGVALERDT